MRITEKHYTPEQLGTLAKRGTARGRAGIEQAQAAWVEVSDGLERARAAGIDPADPHVQELVDRADALIDGFAGGDAAIRASLEQLYLDEGPDRASRGLFTREAFEYTARARAART